MYKKFFRSINLWFSPIINIREALLAFFRYLSFFKDLYMYSKVSDDALNIADMIPCLHDKTEKTPFDPHYIYQHAWIFRKILENKPAWHIDVGSQISFITMLSAVIPVTFIDIRPIQTILPGLTCKEGNILSLPFNNNAVSSISCLHVVEHVGLGRYGDPFDTGGTWNAITELIRVLEHDGFLYLSLPVGKPRVCFNAHRVTCPIQLLHFLNEKGMVLLKSAAVFDGGNFKEDVEMEELKHQSYACGIFVLKKAKNLK